MLNAYADVFLKWTAFNCFQSTFLLFPVGYLRNYMFFFQLVNIIFLVWEYELPRHMKHIIIIVCYWGFWVW